MHIYILHRAADEYSHIQNRMWWQESHVAISCCILHDIVCRLWLQMKFVLLLVRRGYVIQSVAPVSTYFTLQVGIIWQCNITTEWDLKWVKFWSQFWAGYWRIKHFIAQKKKLISIQNAVKQKKYNVRVKRGNRTIMPFSIGLL